MGATIERETGATKALAAYIKERGIKISSIAKKTGLSENVLYPSLGSGRGRKLNIDEFFQVCLCLKLDPTQFCPKEE